MVYYNKYKLKLERKKKKGDKMNISDLLCDLYDIKKQTLFLKFGNLPKTMSTETTIDDCLDNLIEQLESEEEFSKFRGDNENKS